MRDDATWRRHRRLVTLSLSVSLMLGMLAVASST
jgi:hypothetical protein